MQCERLIKMIKSWYLHVREETMAPARMVSFIKEHARTCEICLNDPDLQDEIAKITEIVLPESKIPKAVRQQNMKDKAEAAEHEEEIEDEENNTEVEEEEDYGDDNDDDEIEMDLDINDSEDK